MGCSKSSVAKEVEESIFLHPVATFEMVTIDDVSIDDKKIYGTIDITLKDEYIALINHTDVVNKKFLLDLGISEEEDILLIKNDRTFPYEIKDSKVLIPFVFEFEDYPSLEKYKSAKNGDSINFIVGYYNANHDSIIHEVYIYTAFTNIKGVS